MGRMIGLETEIDNLREQNNLMLIKYSYAYGRKDDYKEQYLDLKKIYDEEKIASEEAKKASEETIKLWKDKAEKEESKKLELKIARELDLQRSEAIETRATELMENFNNLQFAQEAEINILEKKHKEAMATE